MFTETIFPRTTLRHFLDSLRHVHGDDISKDHLVSFPGLTSPCSRRRYFQGPPCVISWTHFAMFTETLRQFLDSLRHVHGDDISKDNLASFPGLTLPCSRRRYFQGQPCVISWTHLAMFTETIFPRTTLRHFLDSLRHVHGSLLMIETRILRCLIPRLVKTPAKIVCWIFGDKVHVG
jgi:sugar phosphate isomerase/epimerase